MKKRIISLVLLFVILFVTVSCGNKKTNEVKPATPVEVVNTAQVKQPEPAKVVEEVKQVVQEAAQTVATETVVLKEEVKETAAEVVAEVVEEVKDFTHKYVYSYQGYDIIVEAHDGYGYVTYPSFITDAEISEALGAFVAAYGDFGVTFKKVAPGKLEVKFAEGLSEEDFGYIAALASESLSWYLDDMFAPVVEEPVVVPAATPAATPVAAPVSTPATPVVVPATTPVEPVVDTTEKERCNSFRIAVRPINFLGQSDNVAYSAGAELTYEYRINRHIGIANSIVYNAYIDKTNPKHYKADYALITDVVGYGRVSENTCLFLSLGVGLGELTDGTEHAWYFDSRVQFGVECHVSDLVAITASSAIQIHFINDNQVASYQPLKVGVQFSF